MGQAQTTQQSQNQSVKINHPKFDSPVFLKDQHSEEEFIQITVPVVNEQQYNSWALKLSDKESPVARAESLMIPRKHSFKKEGLCGSSGFAKIDYDNFPFLLRDEIDNRTNINHKYFEENELWYLMFTLVSSAKEFHNRKLKVGDIRPENIFINEDGQIKLATQFSWPGEIVNYSKTIYEKETTYLCPGEIKDIQFGKYESSIQPDAAEAFSIGLTCLDAALLRNSGELYSKNNKFEYQRLEERLKELRGANYSELLCLVLSNLCEVESDDRCTCNQIYEWLIPHEQAITNLQDFHVNVLPEKIDRTKVKSFGLMILQNQSPHLMPSMGIQGQVPFAQHIPAGMNVRSGPPMSLEQVIAQQRGQHVPGQPLIQLPSHPVTGQTVPLVNIPVSSSNQFSHGQQVVYHSMPQPQQVMQIQPVLHQEKAQQIQYVEKVEQRAPVSETRTQEVISATHILNGNSDAYNKTLGKIDEQLQQSRKMFPS